MNTLVLLFLVVFPILWYVGCWMLIALGIYGLLYNLKKLFFPTAC